MDVDGDSYRRAKAGVLARLWGALAREPLPGVVGRERAGAELRVHLDQGRTVTGPTEAANLFATPEDLVVDGLTDPGELTARLWPEAGQLRAEIDNSVANLASAFAGTTGHNADEDADQRHDAGHAAQDRDTGHDLVFFEQSIVDGHPIHPLCRTRIGMSAAENRAYAPEFRPTIELGIVDVPEHLWITGGAGLPPRLPIHPWQRDHVLGEHPELRLTGESIAARPLMSLRTVAITGQPQWHLKTSVDIQMTSAVRIVSPAAIRNGPVMSALLADLCRDQPIEILAEVATGAVRDGPGGEPLRSLAVIQRAAPRLGPGEVALPFGALCAPDPGTGKAFLAGFIDRPAADFERLMALTLPPLLRLLHRGVALEAHGQNLLVVLRDRVPVRLAYRDMGGVRVHAGRLHRYADPPVLHGDLATDSLEELRTKLFASAVSTVVNQLISTMTRLYGTDPDQLWHTVAAVIHGTYADLPREALPDRAAILGATLPIKATTAMRLSTSPLEDIWAPIRNPMAGR